MLFIPKIEIPKDNRKIGYKVLWQDKSSKKEFNINELDETEIEDIKEFELDIVKGTDHLSDLFYNAKDTIRFYENLSLGKYEWKKILSFYINADGSIQRKNEESYYTLKVKA